ncbi:hypothetical protein GCM10023324_02810 [Streptomyces youssoufiensis]
MSHSPGERTPAPGPVSGPAPGTTQAPAPEHQEARGCLYALSQPPLMLFLSVIATLLLLAAVHDLYRW